MGRATIKAHLGDAHYRIALDIDVGYARRQYDEHTAYLEAFAPKLQAAKDARDALKAAFDAAGVALNDYLTPKREAAEAAYTAMTAAYDAWLAAFTAWDPGQDTFLRDSMNDAATQFFAIHAIYVKCLKGIEDEDTAGWTTATALDARTTRLALWAAAQGDWYGSLTYIDDPTACNDAYDLYGVALSDFENATTAFAADPGNPTLESAMDYYAGETQSAYTNWISVVTQNSGDAYIARLRADYDAAAATFQAAQQELSVTLADGSVAPGLLEKWQAMSEAEERWRNADREYRELLLIKAERVKQRAALWNRLQNFINEDGEPIEQLANAWCVDASEDLAAGTVVGSIEIPGERYEAVRVRPGYESGYVYDASRDGLLQPAWASSPEAVFYNWAIHPGGQRWHPNYRLGVIKALSETQNTATVELDAQTNSPSSKGYDSASKPLDVNNPVKYVIDPDTGAETPVLPGPNIQVTSGVTTLLNVPVQYMECNAGAFAEGDHVIVEFAGRDWTGPKVIGFADTPKPCVTHGLVLAGKIDASYHPVLLKDTPYGAPANIRHLYGGTLAGGNIDWTSADGKTVLTWQGPRGRSLAQQVVYLPTQYAYPPTAGFNWQDEQFIAIRIQMADWGTSGVVTGLFVLFRRQAATIWQNGHVIGTAPAGYLVLGATRVSYTDPETGAKTDYLVGVFVKDFSYDWDPDETGDQVYNLDRRPEAVTHVFAWAALSGGAVPAGGWTTFHEEDCSDDAYLMPPIGSYFFSASGLQFATLIPRVDYGETTNGETRTPRVAVGNDTILRGTLTVGADGPSLVSLNRTPQAQNSGSYFHSHEETGSGYGPWTISVSETIIQSSTAIVGVDFIGEDEVTLSATLSQAINGSNSGSGSGSEGDPGSEYSNGSSSYSDSRQWTASDDHRHTTVGSWSFTRVGSTTSSMAHGETGTRYIIASSDSQTGILKRPIFYDLRYGACLNEISSGTSSASSYRDVLYTLAGNWDGGTQVDESIQVDWALAGRDDETQASHSDLDSISRFTPYSSVDPPIGGGGEGVTVSITITGDYPPDSVSNQCRVGFWNEAGYGAGFGYVQAIPYYRTLHSDAAGDIVCRVNHERYIGCNEVIDMAFRSGQTPQAVDASFATAFDLSAAWQDHQADQHQPDPDNPQDPSAFPGAVAADLQPLFRI